MNNFLSKINDSMEETTLGWAFAYRIRTLMIEFDLMKLLKNYFSFVLLSYHEMRSHSGYG